MHVQQGIYKHLFSFPRKKFFTQTKLTFVKISLNFLLEVLIMY